MGKKMSFKDVESKLDAAGVEKGKLWDFVKTLPWDQVAAFVLSLLAKKQEAQAAKRGTRTPGAGCGPDDVDAIKAHFLAIQALAECGLDCCP